MYCATITITNNEKPDIILGTVTVYGKTLKDLGLEIKDRIDSSVYISHGVSFKLTN